MSLQNLAISNMPLIIDGGIEGFYRCYSSSISRKIRDRLLSRVNKVTYLIKADFFLIL